MYFISVNSKETVSLWFFILHSNGNWDGIDALHLYQDELCFGVIRLDIGWPGCVIELITASK
jgi:hypothetical protein